MEDTHGNAPRSRRWARVAPLAGGMTGLACGRMVDRLLPGSPAWLAPAVVIGSLTLLLVGLLLLPAMRRHRAKVDRRH